MIDTQALWKRLAGVLPKKQFTSNAHMGLSITDAEIDCAVYYISNLENLKAKTFGSVQLPQGSQKLLPGQFVDLQNQYDLKNIKCSWVLSPKDYQLLLIDRPKVMPKEYRAVALWQIKDMLEFPVSDCVIDVFLPSDNLEAHKSKLYVVVAKRSYLTSVVNILTNINISVESIIVREFAERNVISRLEEKKQVIAFLSHHDDMYVLTIFHDDAILFSRRISQNLEFELIRSFEYFNVTLSQAMPQVMLTYDIPEEMKNSLRINLEQSNIPIVVSDISEKYSQFGVNESQEFIKHFYSIGAALQFTIDE